MNLYTEDEARAKICPFLQASCLASGCMAWAIDHLSRPSVDTGERGYCVLCVGAAPTPATHRGRADGA
jgi:hypothetical protein